MTGHGIFSTNNVLIITFPVTLGVLLSSMGFIEFTMQALSTGRYGQKRVQHK